MKKIGILFIFFALIFGLVLLPEVYGINVDDWNYEMEQAEKDCADNAMKILLLPLEVILTCSLEVKSMIFSTQDC